MKNTGNLFAMGAYIAWAIFPIYWKQLSGIDALQLSSHRIVWSLVVLVIWLVATGKLADFWRGAVTWANLQVYGLAGVLLAANWSIYVYAVTNGHIIETSLGYFINPLVSVLLGVVFLRERMRAYQWVAAALAAAGVLYLSVTLGKIPTIALGLAFTFGLYGFMKKRSSLNSTYGLALETGVLFIPAFVYIAWSETTGVPSFLHSDLRTALYLAGGGLVTTIPLLMFAQAAQRIPLSHLGFFQYVTPSATFLLGVLLYREPFDSTRLIGFALVWAGLLVFVAESVFVMWRTEQTR